MAKEPIRLDVTDTLVVTQRFDSRTSEGEKFLDGRFGTWINRLNVALRWDKWTVGARLDSSVYWRRPQDASVNDIPVPERGSVTNYEQTRQQDKLYPAKVWITYAAPGVEVTLGDSYVQFGRGLLLSMRKIDDLGIDTTLRGAKVQIQKDPIAFTVVGGLANPSRVDEPTGSNLFLTRPPEGRDVGVPVFGSDRIVGAELVAGRGLPIVLGTRGVRLTRCSPYRFDARGQVLDSGLSTELGIGSCDPADNRIWFAQKDKTPSAGASEIEMASQSLEIPDIGGHGNLYVEAAVQRRHYDDRPNEPYGTGNAIYGALSADFGPVTNTLEIKSYRNFYPMAAGINSQFGGAFSNVTYSLPPTGEQLTQDSMFGNFNVCVDGGRLRSNVRLNQNLLVYGQGIYAYTKSEIDGAGCDDKGHTLPGTQSASAVQTTVVDGLTGVEWNFDNALSHFYGSGGVRNDVKENDEFFYREVHVEYAFQKHISGPYTVEITGRFRDRKEEHQNVRDGSEQYWREGENYVAFKIAPKWIFSQGFEYMTRTGYPTYYFNGSILYKFTSDSNIRLFAGQQRGGLRCISGVCRQFPAFNGARMELTLRF